VTTEDGQSAAESLHAVPVSSQGVIQSVAAATADSCRKTLAVIAVREALARLDSDQDREIAEAIYVEGESVRAAAEKLGMTKSELSVRLAEIHEFLATALADFQEEL
jgi:DNA-directed RNA polymerase specialized sigma24 family protein